jgi:glutamyl-tRNA synthetase
VLNEQGEKMSKRNGAKPVTQFRDEGFLPEAMVNYLARLGWSHGDDELFTAEQMVAWFDGSHLNKSPAQWDPAKLLWVNAHHMKQADDARLAALVVAQLEKRGIEAAADDAMVARCALLKDRCHTTVELADWIEMFFKAVTPAQADLDQHVTDVAKAALRTLREKLETVAWDKASLAAAMKETLAAHAIKMPQLAIPLRVIVCGRAQTPAIDALLALFQREVVLDRLRAI